MKLYRPWILKFRIGPLKPQARLNRILAAPHQCNNALRIEPAYIIDGLQEEMVKFILLTAMLLRRPRRFVDGLKRDFASFARQLGPDLHPEAVQFLFDFGDVGGGLCDVCPCPAVVVHVDDDL